MEFESTATAGDSMTIDYDFPEPSHSAVGADAEMGDELAKDADLSALEADMVDDVALVRAADATGLDGDADIAIDEDLVDTSPSTPVIVPFSAAASPPIPPFSAFTTAPVVSPAPFVTVTEVEIASEPIITVPESAFSAAVPADPILTSAPVVVPAPAEVAPPVELPTSCSPSLGDGGAAARAVEPLEDAGPAAVTTDAVAAVSEAALAEELDLVPNEDDVPNNGLPEAVIETAVDGAEPASQEGAELVALQEKSSVVDDDAAILELEPSSVRPLVNKDPLLDIIVPVRSPVDPSSSARGVPAVFLSMGAPQGWTTYSLFHAESRSVKEEDEHVQEDSELLLGDTAQHELYYQPLATLFGMLRTQLEFLEHDGDELILEFDEIGLTISEDNMYSHQVTLFDFDRIHTGCQIPGRLHANLATQPRFSAGFNALALHIAGSLAASADEGEGEGAYAAEEEGDESTTLEGDDELEEGEPEEGELDERAVEGPADDHDGPDSELVGAHAHGADGVGEEEEQAAEDEFDLESALAQLDGDDVVAVIEGAQEDLILAGAGEERGEEHEVARATAQEEPLEGAPEEAHADAFDVALEGAPEEAHADALEEALEEAHVEAHVEATEEAPEARETAQDGTKEAQPQQLEEGREEGQVAEVPGQPGNGDEVAQERKEDPPVGEHVELEDIDDGRENASLAPRDEAVDSEPIVERDDEITAPNASDTAATTTEGDQSAMIELQDITENAAEMGTPASPELQADTADEFAGAIDAFATSAESEEPTNSTDVVIDYDDAFDGGPASAPPASPKDAVDAHSHLAPLEPKRSREDDEQDVVEESAGDAKRPRLAEPLEVTSA
ncbi:hypothetical protein JCM3770_003896 [Rhodotorula araucariae]